MPHRPPRREPRVLALDRVRAHLRYACADPWELRCTGAVRLRPGTERLAIRRLVRREKPTAVAAQGSRLRKAATHALRASGPPVLPRNPACPPHGLAAELFPEFALFAPTPAHRRSALLAIAAAIEAPVTPRHYATSRHHSVSRTAGSPGPRA